MCHMYILVTSSFTRQKCGRQEINRIISVCCGWQLARFFRIECWVFKQNLFVKFLCLSEICSILSQLPIGRALLVMRSVCHRLFRNNSLRGALESYFAQSSWIYNGNIRRLTWKLSLPVGPIILSCTFSPSAIMHPSPLSQFVIPREITFLTQDFRH